MNASVHQFPMSARAEARRLRTLHSMRAVLHAQGMELSRIATLDNDEASAALRVWEQRLIAEAARGLRLAEDFDHAAAEEFEALENACAKVDAQDDAIEAEEAAAARWDAEHQ